MFTLETLTWDALKTSFGCGAIVTLIIQGIKLIAGKEINKWWIRLITYLLSVAVLILANLFTGTLTTSSFVLSFLGGMLVFLASTAEYHVLLKEAVAVYTRIKDALVAPTTPKDTNV